MTTPNYLNEDRSEMRGVKPGWYAMDGAGKIKSGPFSSHEKCLSRSTQPTQPEEQTEEESILAFTVPDEALEHAADTNFSLGNCTDARMCQAPNDRPRQSK